MILLLLSARADASMPDAKRNCLVTVVTARKKNPRGLFQQALGINAKTGSKSEITIRQPTLYVKAFLRQDCRPVRE
jgi:hypothetical protein